jgi:hypothetical protein
MRPTNYILKNKMAVPCDDMLAWATSMSTNRTVVKTERGKYLISTVFLGIDHSDFDSGEPILFETMVFIGGDYGTEKYCDRYSTYKEAQDGHFKACKKFFTNYTRDDMFLDMI